MKRTPEEVKAWYKKMGDVAAKIRAMSSQEQEEAAGKIGTVTCEGHRLSMFNTIFLWTQAGRALLQIGGVQQWRKIGRAVQKGQHAAGYIYVPIGSGPKSEKSEGQDEEENTRTYFRLIPVFDVSQTVEIEVGEAVHA